MLHRVAPKWLLPCVTALLLATGASAHAGPLFDGRSVPGFPEWIRYLPPGVSDAVGPAGVTLDTTRSNSLRAGYSRVDQVLDSARGFTLAFTARLVSEWHRANRAGFNVIVLDTQSRGVELGFWPGEIWAQSAGFTRAEHGPVDTTVTTDYSLVFAGATYTLLAGGKKVLSGALRRYEGPPLPYAVPSLIFFGDDSGSARAKVTISSIALGSNAARPLPTRGWPSRVPVLGGSGPCTATLR